MGITNDAVRAVPSSGGLMEAGVDTSALPSMCGSPAWAIRVPRPPGDGFRMAEQLPGVPKPMLRTVFGDSLGRRIWELVRRNGGQRGAGPLSRVSDVELSKGMVEFLSQRAAETLHARGRQARAIRLTITYADRESLTARTHLPTPTNESSGIVVATMGLLRQFPACGVRSIDLAVTAIEAASVPEQIPAPACSLASAQADVENRSDILDVLGAPHRWCPRPAITDRQAEIDSHKMPQVASNAST
jgi:impB/mucB/samB family C-terminal domain